jgi:hypothetical protein
MSHRLRATFDPDTDGTGALTVEVRAGDFAGVGSAWFASAQIAEFAHLLGSLYPLPSEPVRLQGGYWGESRPPTLQQPHVDLAFYPIGPLGTIGCRVELATRYEASARAAEQSRVGVELLTSYEPLGQFARSLAAVANGQASEAVLEAHGT